jgi:hypothetical protein
MLNEDNRSYCGSIIGGSWGSEDSHYESVMQGVFILADAIKDMGGISSVNLLKNKIGSDQAEAFATILKEHPTLKSLCGNTGDETELDMSGKNMDAGDVTMLAAEVVGNGAILSVNLLKNGIGVEQARALASILKEHSTLESLCGNKGDETELDMSGKMNGAEDAIMLAAEIIDNGALSVLNLAENNLGAVVFPHGWRTSTPWKFRHSDGSHQDTDPGEELVQGRPEGAIAIANAIPDMGALTALDVSNNCLGEIVLVDGITHCKADSGKMLYWDKDNKSLGEKLPPGCGPPGIIVIANAIPDMGAITSLNLASNSLGIEGAKIIADILPKCT